ncbi:MAG: UDP-N-acetylmuramoyl-L-alanine--D-glutamate ligase [Clostridia bacterium]
MKSYLIYGYGKSGKSLYEYLKKSNIVHIYDDNLELSISFQEAIKLIPTLDYLILSPGVARTNKLCLLCSVFGVTILGETEFAIENIKAQIVAVTGTNGKTTTCEMINHILNIGKKSSFLAGNIGTPLTQMCDKLTGQDIAVVEMSSFQLEEFNTFSPYISIVINVDIDHLDRHLTKENYQNCKANIFINQQRGYSLFNYDDLTAYELSKKARTKVGYVSLTKKVNGCYFDGKDIIVDFFDIKMSINSPNIKYYVRHNISNLMFAVLVGALYDLTKQEIELAINTFAVSAHRMEFVKTLNNIAFYNDSKGTNIHSTLSAISSLGECCLILGGSDKGYDFDELIRNLSSCKFIACLGQTKNKILSSCQKYNFTSVEGCDSLEECCLACYNYARLNHIPTILLSPACASFDMFKNYQERGERFKEIVNSLS